MSDQKANSHAGNSLDDLLRFTLNTLSPGQSMDGSGVTAGNDYSLDAGATIAIGEVFYDVTDGASAGPFTISFSPIPATSFSDINGAPLTFSH